MLFLILFACQVLIQVQSSIWSNFNLPPADTSLRSHRLECTLKADALDYCAARINRDNFTCDPLPVQWCQKRTKLSDYYYMEKLFVQQSDLQFEADAISGFHGFVVRSQIPIWLEHGSEISFEIIFSANFKRAYNQVAICFRHAADVLSNTYSNGQCIRLMDYTNWSGIPNMRFFGFDGSIYTPYEINTKSLLTLKFTSNGLQALFKSNNTVASVTSVFGYEEQFEEIVVYKRTAAIDDLLIPTIQYTAAQKP